MYICKIWPMLSGKTEAFCLMRDKADLIRVSVNMKAKKLIEVILHMLLFLRRAYNPLSDGFNLDYILILSSLRTLLTLRQWPSTTKLFDFHLHANAALLRSNTHSQALEWDWDLNWKPINVVNAPLSGWRRRDIELCHVTRILMNTFFKPPILIMSPRCMPGFRV